MGVEFRQDNEQMVGTRLKADEVSMMLSGARLQLLERASEMRRCGEAARANWLVLMANRLRETIEEVNGRLQRGG